MKKKVFCKPCKHHGETKQGIVSRECYHPKNIVDNWFDKNFDTVSLASRINEKNDCKWFEPCAEEED